MKRIVFIFIICLVILVGCQSGEFSNQQHFSNKATIIEVYEWDGSTLLHEIDDESLINELIEKLNKAKTYSTANMDFPLPDYKLIFLNNNAEELFTIGYYNEVVSLGVKGRYLDVNQDMMYNVDLQLPFY